MMITMELYKDINLSGTCLHGINSVLATTACPSKQDCLALPSTGVN